MNTRTLYWIAGSIVLLLLAAGVAGALPGRAYSSPSLEGVTGAAIVGSAISYQGSLTNPGGGPVNGMRDMQFIVFDDESAGIALWDSGVLAVDVDGGLFTVQLDVDPAVFNGQALWLQISVEGENLSPRQALLAVPYALSLRPGADIVANGLPANDAALASYAPATGTALYAIGNEGAGLVGSSDATYGVWGNSTNGWGGYFSSTNGYGARVVSTGAAHWDHGAYVSANGGYGVYAQSTNNMGVRAEAGNIGGIAQPLGAVGVTGLGAGRGMYGGSINGTGVYGRSESNYGGYFYSDAYHGIRSSSPEGYFAGRFINRGGMNEPGIYVDGTIVASGSKSGYVVDISVNAAADDLELGDVVSVVGAEDPVVGEIPVMRVVKATTDSSTAVVGVVDQRFVVEPDPDEAVGATIVRPDGAAAVRAAGTGIQPGEYVSVVTLGAFKQIKVDASYGPIQPGDLLTPSPNPGFAMRAQTPVMGTIVGKALSTLESGQGVIPVYVTVQ